MATPKYDKLKAFNTGIANAVRYGLGKKEANQEKEFAKKYTSAAKLLTGATDDDAFQSFVRPFVGQMQEAILAYQANPNDPKVMDKFKEAMNALNSPRDEYATTLESEAKEVLGDDAWNRLEDKLRSARDDIKKSAIASELIGKL
jgi:hypothetical protein